MIELLVVIGIIVILFSIVLIAVDPARRFAQSRNANRFEDVRDLVEAVLTYMTDNGGNYPSGIDAITTSSQVLGTATTGCDTTCTATTTVSSCLDLSSALVGGYIAEIPKDLKSGTVSNTDYALNKDADGRIRVTSCDPELGVGISVAR